MMPAMSGRAGRRSTGAGQWAQVKRAAANLRWINEFAHRSGILPVA
ncbi:hypothetical protein [Falsiroseomonas sp. E2-1-a20]